MLYVGAVRYAADDRNPTGVMLRTKQSSSLVGASPKEIYVWKAVLAHAALPPLPHTSCIDDHRCCVAAIIFRRIFLWGNKGRNSRLKKEWRAAAMTKAGQKVHSAKRKKRGITLKRCLGICRYWCASLIV